MIRIYIANNEVQSLLDANADLFNSQYDLKDVRLSPPYIKCSYVLNVWGIHVKVPVDIEVVSTGTAIEINFHVRFGPFSQIASNEAAAKVLTIMKSQGLLAWKHGGSIFIDISGGETYCYEVDFSNEEVYFSVQVQE